MWEGDNLNKYGFKEDEKIKGLFKFKGGINCELSAKKIIATKSALKFIYDVDGEDVTRQFDLERDSNGKITVFTNPDGTRTEVIRQ